MYIINVISKLFIVLRTYSIRQYAFLQAFYLLSAIVQVLGVASIAPFIGILSSPSMIHSNKYLSSAYNFGSFSNDLDFIIAFALLTFLLIIMSNIISGITLWLTFRFSVNVGAKLQKDLLGNLLHREYIFHKSNNNTHSISLIAQETPRFVYMILQPFLLLTSHAFISLVIIGGLFFIDPYIALSSIFIIGGSYLVTYIFLRKSLSFHGRVMTERNNGIQSVLSESFNGIKDIKLKGLESSFIDKFGAVNKRGLLSSSFINLAGDLPKLVIETVSFGAILFLTVALLTIGSDTEHVVSIMSLYAVAGYKLLPSMQQMYKSMSAMSAHGGVAFTVSNELNFPTIKRTMNSRHNIDSIMRLSAKNISFSYSKNQDPVISNLSLNFQRGTLNTIVGPSGSGKSTLVDILIGLLLPSNGEILVNDRILNEDDWRIFQSNVSYVPQHIFITNDNVANNIAFGTSENDIDYDRVKEALKNSSALDFVEKLPDGIYSLLGQDGKLLSGGQRQRIGIARALYNNTSLLILDEPTSALDIESEYELMNVLHSLKDKMLIIIISHRPAAIKLSDNIAIIKNGSLEDSGSYDFLINNSEVFKKLMRKNNMSEKHIQSL